MLKLPYLEITTQIGCRVNCIKYCPQELIVKKHAGMLPLTLEKFKSFISTVPTDISISFAGFCEPFLNQECTDMITWAHTKGHTIQIYSTLVGLTKVDAERIAQVPIEHFVLHLPDAEGNANISITKDYLDVLGIILSGVHNLSFMNMGAEFITCNVENIARGKPLKKIRGRVICPGLIKPNYSMLPNGDVYYCCVTRGLTEKVGSLNESTYPELIDKGVAISHRLQTDPESICHSCGNASVYWKFRLHNLKCRVSGNKPILGTI